MHSVSLLWFCLAFLAFDADAGSICSEPIGSTKYASVLIVQKDRIVPERNYSIDRLFTHKHSTITVSNQKQYVDALYDFLCAEGFERGEYNGFTDGGNYTGVFFSYEYIDLADYEMNKYEETFSLAGDCLYGGDGTFSRKVGQGFRNRFHFSGSDLSFYGVP